MDWLEDKLHTVGRLVRAMPHMFCPPTVSTKDCAVALSIQKELSAYPKYTRMSDAELIREFCNMQIRLPAEQKYIIDRMNRFVHDRYSDGKNMSDVATYIIKASSERFDEQQITFFQASSDLEAFNYILDNLLEDLATCSLMIDDLCRYSCLRFYRIGRKGTRKYDEFKQFAQY